MKFTYLDYCMLLSAYFHKGDLLEGMCEYLPDIPTADSLAFSIQKLNASQFLSGETITEKGITFFRSNKKLFESKKKTAKRLEELFLSLSPEADDIQIDIDKESLSARIDKIHNEYNSSAIFALSGNTLTANIPKPETTDEEIVDDEITLQQTEFVLCDGELQYIVNAFLDIAISLTDEYKNRKICLWCEDGAYVLSLLPSKQGVRICANKILFNKKSFKGKLDGKLDYAQTTPSVLTFDVGVYTLSESLCFFAACCENITDFPYEKLELARGASK